MSARSSHIKPWYQDYFTVTGAIVLFFALVIMFLNYGVFVAEDLIENRRPQWTYYAVTELSSAIVAFILVIPLLHFFGRYPLRRTHIWIDLLKYLLVSILFGLAYTTLMYGMRVPILQLMEIDIADKFNRLFYRYAMEYFKQFLFFWVIYFVHVVFIQASRRKDETIAIKELQEKLLMTELQAIQNGLNPHFLFNTLNTISSIVYDDPTKADELIVQLSDFLRKIINLHKTPLHSIEKELELTDLYINIMHSRFEERLLINKTIDLRGTHRDMPVMILQPIIENAIQYSIDVRDQVVIDISVVEMEDGIHFKVLDNGPGATEDEMLLAEGIGFKSVVERLSKWYGTRFSYSVRQLPVGTLVSLIILNE